MCDKELRGVSEPKPRSVKRSRGFDGRAADTASFASLLAGVRPRHANEEEALRARGFYRVIPKSNRNGRGALVRDHKWRYKSGTVVTGVPGRDPDSKQPVVRRTVAFCASNGVTYVDIEDTVPSLWFQSPERQDWQSRSVTVEHYGVAAPVEDDIVDWPKEYGRRLAWHVLRGLRGRDAPVANYRDGTDEDFAALCLRSLRETILDRSKEQGATASVAPGWTADLEATLPV